MAEQARLGRAHVWVVALSKYLSLYIALSFCLFLEIWQIDYHWARILRQPKKRREKDYCSIISKCLFSAGVLSASKVYHCKIYAIKLLGAFQK